MTSGHVVVSASSDVDIEAAGERHDAIVVGAGAAGSLAARLLSRAGLRTLVLDAGYTPPVSRAPFRRAFQKAVRLAADPRLIRTLPPRLVSMGQSGLRIAGRIRQPVQVECYAWERAPELFVDDRDNPYSCPHGSPFTWIRARGVGGRMAVPGHGRQYYRLSAQDFEPRDGASPVWPLTVGELDPWYDFAEKLLLLRGRREGIASVPDSTISTFNAPNAAEQRVLDLVAVRWPECDAMLSRYAPPGDLLAIETNSTALRIRRGAIAAEVLIGRRGVRGVRWIDQEHRRACVTEAPLVFIAASALESTRLLLLSSDASGRRLAESLPALGRNLMDHVMVKTEGHAVLDEPVPHLEDGRCLYLPRFDARQGRGRQSRGFGVQLYQYAGVGRRSYLTAVSFGEMLPRASNRVVLDPELRDRWGIPALQIAVNFADDEIRRARQQSDAMQELAALLGANITHASARPFTPGTAAHECGTARIGWSAQDSVLSPFNECWAARGLYVTDGAAFPSQGIQNPTLTILALTARACDHAIRASGGDGLRTEGPADDLQQDERTIGATHG